MGFRGTLDLRSLSLLGGEAVFQQIIGPERSQDGPIPWLQGDAKGLEVGPNMLVETFSICTHIAG